MVYESLIVGALVLLGSAIATAFARGAVGGAGQWLLQTLLVALLAGYFILSWHRGGQTIAMRAWRLRATTTGGAPLTLGRAALRFVLAGLTVGLASGAAVVLAKDRSNALAWLALVPAIVSVGWGFFDAQGRFLYDRLSGTRLVHEKQRGTTRAG
jgi:uncharacterized RDD family membrane protein YckC